jgi:hypothetical protein
LNTRRRSQRLAASIALFAIWLTVFAPLGSRLLAREKPPAAAICSAGQPHATAAGESQSPAHHHLDACGYCSLLAHCPALCGASTVHLAVRAVRCDEVASADLPCARPSRYLRRPSRAPPAIA